MRLVMIVIVRMVVIAAVRDHDTAAQSGAERGCQNGQRDNFSHDVAPYLPVNRTLLSGEISVVFVCNRTCRSHRVSVAHGDTAGSFRWAALNTDKRLQNRSQAIERAMKKTSCAGLPPGLMARTAGASTVDKWRTSCFAASMRCGYIQLQTEGAMRQWECGSSLSFARHGPQPRNDEGATHAGECISRDWLTT